jgi:hypothetical protein
MTKSFCFPPVAIVLVHLIVINPALRIVTGPFIFHSSATAHRYAPRGHDVGAFPGRKCDRAIEWLSIFLPSVGRCDRVERVERGTDAHRHRRGDLFRCRSAFVTSGRRSHQLMLTCDKMTLDRKEVRWHHGWEVRIATWMCSPREYYAHQQRFFCREMGGSSILTSPRFQGWLLINLGSRAGRSDHRNRYIPRYI